jgi:hypothetical protein
MNKTTIALAIAGIAAGGYIYYKKKHPTQAQITRKIQDEFDPNKNLAQTIAGAQSEINSLIKRYPPPTVNPSMSEETAVYNQVPAPQISQQTLDGVSATNPDGSIINNGENALAGNTELPLYFSP